MATYKSWKILMVKYLYWTFNSWVALYGDATTTSKKPTSFVCLDCSEQNVSSGRPQERDLLHQSFPPEQKSCRQARNGRVQIAARGMCPLQIGLHPLGMCKILEACWSARLKTWDAVPHPRVDSAEPPWLEIFSYAVCFAQYCREDCAIKALFLWSWQRRFIRLCIIYKTKTPWP